MGANLTFSWPQTNSGFNLQSTTNLTSGIWSNITSPPAQVVGTNWQVSLPIPAPGFSFFRLAN